ncbi:MAG: metal ABC transporter permease [Clostridia bacterium]|nr:metal ABC transporter permease [Clostridia bacterium]MBQ2949387.1 metal ABC transporter permease [Clostridia bacterium]MBQ4608934.1 metal ABC transporter permease [Clostridia bacterium]MBQ6858175.1 metal ABC transporter permease [Clostridia bacterium]
METLYAAMDMLLPFEWLRYTFMKNALLAMLLITPLFGLLGTMAVDNKMAFFSDALGHSALTGIAIGVVLGWENQMASMLVFGVIWAILITFVKHHSKMSADTIISVFSSTSIALGLVVLSRGGAFAKYSSVLVGDVLSVTQGDLLALLLALAAACAVWVFLFNPLMITSVNSPLARSRGIRSRMTEYAFTILVAVAVMVSIRWVGVMLINSLLILPAAASRNVARGASQYMRLSVIISVVCGVAGLVLSYYLNTSAGAAVVLCCAAVYFVTLPMRRK